MKEFEPKRQIPKEEKQDWDKRPDQPKGCDKGGHAERSRNNDTGQHNNHWKKVERGRNE